MSGPAWSDSFALPPDFRPHDFFAFHRRDSLEVAERVAGDTLQKGLTWEGRAACLTIRLQQGWATAQLAFDDAPPSFASDEPERLVRRMLGLTQQIGEFERTYRVHPQVGRLIARHPGLRVPLAATPLEALTWAVTGQQISVGAAVALRRKLILAAGLRHSCGLSCYPGSRRLAALEEDDLRRAGFSRSKARALIALSRSSFPWQEWSRALPVAEWRGWGNVAELSVSAAGVRRD